MPRCLVLGAIALEGPETLILAPTALKSRQQDARRGPVFGPDDLGYLEVLKSTQTARLGRHRAGSAAPRAPDVGRPDGVRGMALVRGIQDAQLGSLKPVGDDAHVSQ